MAGVGYRHKRKRGQFIPFCEDLDLHSNTEEAAAAVKLYNAADPVASAERMARALRPKKKLADSIDEMAIFIIHLRRAGKI